MTWFSRMIDALTVCLLCLATWVYYDAKHQPLQGTRPTIFHDSIMTRLPAINAAGDSVDLLQQSQGNEMLIAIFRSDCPVCQRQKSSWERIAMAAGRRHVTMVAITPEPMSHAISAYFSDSVSIGVNALREPTAFGVLLQTDVVPTTILVDRGGRILFHHAGLLQDADVDVLNARLGL